MTNSSKHPKGLYVLFFTMLWERFGYYGLRALLVLYMIKALMFDKNLGSEIYGSYTGLVFLTPLLGGYIADKYWGNCRTIFWGGIMMAVGHFLMFMSASVYETVDIARMFMFGGLGFVILGNGFFKPTLTSMVGQLYPKSDNRLDSAYTLFYMGINTGAFIAPLVCGFFGDTGNPSDFKWGFLLASVGMIVSVIVFELTRSKYLVDPDGVKLGLAPNDVTSNNADNGGTEKVTHSKSNQWRDFFIWGGVFAVLAALFHYVLEFDLIGTIIFASCIALPGYIVSDRSLTKEERSRIFVIYIIAFFVIFFWSAFEQAGASLTFFADEQTNRNVMGWEMPASYFQSFNAVFIVTLAPIFAALWIWMGKKKIEPSSPVKQAIGLMLLAIGYLIIAFGVKGIEPGVKVSMMWLVSLYFIHTIGELFLSPIGLSMVNKLAPQRLGSLLMGVWFMSTATANKFAGILSSYYPEEGKSVSFIGFPIENLFDFFMLFVVMAAVASVILLLLSKWLQKNMHGIK